MEVFLLIDNVFKKYMEEIKTNNYLEIELKKNLIYMKIRINIFKLIKT